MRERGEERERIKNRDFQKEMSGKQRMRGGKRECKSWERGEEVKTGYVTRHEERIIPQKKL